MAGSIIGRQWARKNQQPCFLWTLNIISVPLYYFLAFKWKHVNSPLDSYRPRPSFNECLENYPITRRAWKRALAVRGDEMKDIRNAISK